MKTRFELSANARKDIGKGASRRLRKQGLVPGIIYGAGKEAELLTFDHNKLSHVADNENFYSSLLKIKIGSDRDQEVIFKDIQRHPVKPKIVHIDFQRVLADVALRVRVPLHIVGEEHAPGIKDKGALSRLLAEVEISCLPRYLPEYLTADVSELALGKALHLSDLKLPEGVELCSLIGKNKNDLPVASIHLVKEVVEEVVAPVAAEGEAAAAEGAEGKAAEGKEAGKDAKGGDAKAADGKDKKDAAKPEGKKDAPKKG